MKIRYLSIFYHTLSSPCGALGVLLIILILDIPFGKSLVRVSGRSFLIKLQPQAHSASLTQETHLAWEVHLL